MNTIDLAYFEVNEHGRLLSGNRRFCRMFGFEPSELPWHYVTDLYRYTSDWESFRRDTQSASRKQDAVNYQKEVIAKAEAAARQNNPQNNQNNQNRWQDRRRMMMGGGNMPGGMPGGFRGGMPGMPGGGMMPGGFNRFGNNNGQGGTQPGSGFNRFGGNTGSGFNRGNFGGNTGGSFNRGGAPGGR